MLDVEEKKIISRVKAELTSDEFLDEIGINTCWEVNSIESCEEWDYPSIHLELNHKNDATKSMSVDVGINSLSCFKKMGEEELYCFDWEHLPYFENYKICFALENQVNYLK